MQHVVEQDEFMIIFRRNGKLINVIRDRPSAIVHQYLQLNMQSNMT